MNSSEKYQEQLAKLTAAYSKRLANEIEDLQVLAWQLDRLELSELGLLTDLRGRLHKMAGAAGTFGFAEIGSQARELEYLTRAAASAEPLTTQQREGLITGIRQLPTLLARAATGQAEIKKSSFRSVAANRTIAVATADEVLRDDVCKTLHRFGYQTHGFAGFVDFRAAIEAMPVDALILDISSHNAACELEPVIALQRASVRPLPLIVISGQAEFDLQVQAVRAGALGFLTLPVDIPALESRLESCFATSPAEPFRALIVDDDQVLAERFQTVLHSAGMLAEVVAVPSRLLEEMHRFRPDVVLMDLSMPEYSGPELAQVLRLHDEWLRVPIVYLSAETDAQRQMAALLKAGDDFVTKPISDNALLTTVYSRAQRARRASQALTRDSLTGLLRHADIKEQVTLEVERSVRAQSATSIAMIDLDNFRRVNDQHGHALGDHVIRALANLLRQRLRKIDRLGRYGGEEFVAILPDCPAADAFRVLDDIRRDFSTLLFGNDAGALRCTFSAGISSCEAPQWMDSDLLGLAEVRLAEAKMQGRNQIIAGAVSTERDPELAASGNR